MGQVCSCEKQDDFQMPIKDMQIQERLSIARSSMKRMKTLSDNYNIEGQKQMEDEKYSSPLKTGEELSKDQENKYVPSTVKKSLFGNPNQNKLKQFDHDLKLRLESIGNLANEFELYLALTQHEENEFGELGENKEKVDEHIIKTEVIDVVAQISENQTKNIEKTIGVIQSTFEVLKQNMKDDQSFSQISSSIPENFTQLDQHIKEMKKLMSEIKQKWFTSLDRQHYSMTLNEKITLKLDKVNIVQGQLGELIDGITQEIEQRDIDDVQGESACMLIQQHIVAANLLLDKVDKIKDQMDRGELDGRSNLGSMLNSVADQELGLSSENSSQNVSRLTSSKLKKTVRTESNLKSQNQSIRSQKFQDQFQIQSAHDGSDDEEDQEEKSKTDNEKVKESDQTSSVQDAVGNSLINQVTSNANGNENLKSQENQLLKYNSIYDKLRKKRDLLECLLIQRKFLSQVKNIKYQCKEGGIAEIMTIDKISVDLFQMLDNKKAKKLIESFKSKSESLINNWSQNKDKEDKEQQSKSLQELQNELQDLFIEDFDEWIEEQINALTQDEKSDENAEKLEKFKKQQVKALEKRIGGMEKKFDSFFKNIENMLEVTVKYQNISLLHMVLKTELETMATGKVVIEKELDELKKINFITFTKDLEALKGGDEFQKDEMKTVLQKMKQLIIDQNNILKKIKTQEATLISIVLLANSINGEKKNDDQPAQLGDICLNLVAIMQELLRDQGTINKKWSSMLSEKETIEIGGTEHKIQIDKCIKELAQVQQISKTLMKVQKDDSLPQLCLILIKIGFFSKNIQMGKQIYLQQNYAAQRVKNIAQQQQAIKNVEIKKGQLQIVKKNYKGKIEVLKKHQQIESYYDQNCKLKFDFENPLDKKIAGILMNSKGTLLANLKFEKTEKSQYKIGVEKQFTTDFFFLNKAQESSVMDISYEEQGEKSEEKTQSPKRQKQDDSQPKHVCFKYGQGVLLFNENFCGQLALTQVRARIQKNLLLEQNGLSKQSIAKIKAEFKDCHMLLPFIK